MNIQVKARHMEVTDAIRQYVETKAAKISRFYSGIHTIEVILDVEAEKPSVEIIVSAKHKNVFVATHRDDDMYACVDQCLHKLSQQLRRHKDRVRHHRGTNHSETVELGEQ